MTHPFEEEIVDGHYSGLSLELREHLSACAECAALYREITETLEAASKARVPERGDGYGAEVWARLSARLPARKPNQLRVRWLIAPALAALLSLTFGVGMWTERVTHPVMPVQVTFSNRPLLPVMDKAADVATARPVPTVHRKKPPQKIVFAPEVGDDKKLLALNNQLGLNSGAALPQVLAMIHGDTSDRTKEHALFVLAQSNSPQARQALLEIVRQNSDPMLQTRAVRMMGLAGDDRARKELVGLYQKSSNAELRKEILNDLSVETKATPDAQKKEVLSSVFLAGNSQVLVDVLKNQPNADVRVATIRSLGVMGEQSNALISVYQAANEEQVRQAVLDAFVVQENADALSDLLERESDPRRKTEILRRIALVQARRGK